MDKAETIVLDLKVGGDNLSFDTVAVVYGTRLTTHHFGTVDGDTIHLTRKTGEGSSQGTKFDAHRATN
jgi:hypothetical protein